MKNLDDAILKGFFCKAVVETTEKYELWKYVIVKLLKMDWCEFIEFWYKKEKKYIMTFGILLGIRTNVIAN